MQKSAKIIITFLSVLIFILLLVIGGLVVFGDNKYSNRDSLVNNSNQVNANLDKQSLRSSLVSQNQKGKVEVIAKGGTQYLIYTDKNSKKINIDKAVIDQKKAFDGKMISRVKLSPQGRYVVYYIRTELDGGNMYMYDIETNKKIHIPLAPMFSINDNYMILCGKSYPGFPLVQVYLMPEHKKVFDVFGRFCDGAGEGCEGKYGVEFYKDYDIENCDYTKIKDGVFSVVLKKEEKDESDSLTGKILDKKTIEYKLQ